VAAFDARVMDAGFLPNRPLEQRLRAGKPRSAAAPEPGQARDSARSMPVMVNAMVMVVVMPMMRRIRQRNVCEKNQRGRKRNNLTHDSIPDLSM
jgi:hypothetical protein